MCPNALAKSQLGDCRVLHVGNGYKNKVDAIAKLDNKLPNYDGFWKLTCLIYIVSKTGTHSSSSNVSSIALYISWNLKRLLWFSTHLVSHIEIIFSNLVLGEYSFTSFFNISVLSVECLMKFHITLTVPKQFRISCTSHEWTKAKFKN